MLFNKARTVEYMCRYDLEAPILIPEVGSLHNEQAIVLTSQTVAAN